MGGFFSPHFFIFFLLVGEVEGQGGALLKFITVFCCGLTCQHKHAKVQCVKAMM